MGLLVTDGGWLVAAASRGEPITSESVADTAGTWRGTFFGTVRDTLLRIAVLGAGGGYRNANICVCTDSQAKVALRDSTIIDSAGCGVTVTAESTLSAENNTYENNAEGEVQRIDA